MKTSDSVSHQTTLDEFAVGLGMTPDMVMSLLFNLGLLMRIPRGGRAYPTAFAIRYAMLQPDGEGSYLLSAQGAEMVGILMEEKMHRDHTDVKRGQREPFVTKLTAVLQDHERLYGKDYLHIIAAPFIEETLKLLDNPDVAELYDVPVHAAALARWISHPGLIDPRRAIAS